MPPAPRRPRVAYSGHWRPGCGALASSITLSSIRIARPPFPLPLRPQPLPSTVTSLYPVCTQGQDQPRVAEVGRLFQRRVKRLSGSPAACRCAAALARAATRTQLKAGTRPMARMRRQPLARPATPCRFRSACIRSTPHTRQASTPVLPGCIHADVRMRSRPAWAAASPNQLGWRETQSCSASMSATVKWHVRGRTMPAILNLQSTRA